MYHFFQDILGKEVFLTGIDIDAGSIERSRTRVTSLGWENINFEVGNIPEEKQQPPIKIETTKATSLLHKNGTISMARSEPNSATSSFFICINDQPELDFGGKRNSDGQGFAAFGQVTKGMDVVLKIQSQKSENQYLT